MTDVAGVVVIVHDAGQAPPQAVRRTIDELKRKGLSLAVMLGAADGGKVQLFAGLSDDLVDRGLDAVAWIRAAAKQVRGGGGGRPDMAQAGGKDPEGLSAALVTALEHITDQLAGQAG